MPAFVPGQAKHAQQQSAQRATRRSRSTGFIVAAVLAAVESPPVAAQAAAGAAASSPAASARAASPASAASAAEVTLAPIKVPGTAPRSSATGPDEGYRVERSQSATRTDTPLIETPQAVSVVPRQLMDDRNARSLGEALDMVAGISRRENYYFSDDPFLRGFYLDPSSGFFRDGFRYYNGVAIDTGLLERVEVVKGPASVLYGGLEPGGLISLVSKRPLAEPLLYFKQEVGRWNDYKTTLDWSTPFGGGGGIRVPVMYRHAESFRDEVDGTDFQIAPVVQWRLGARTSLTAQGYYARQQRTNDNLKIPLFEGEPVDVPRSRFLGEPGAKDKVRFASGTVALEHAIGDALNYRGSVTRYDSRERFDRVITFFGFEDAGRTLTRFAGFGEQNFKAWATQHELLGSFAVAGTTHRWLVGAEHFRQNEQRPVTFGTLPSIDVFEPRYDDTFTPFAAREAQGSTRNRLTGFYLQDQATLVQDRPGIHKLDLLVGVRHDRSRQSFDFENAFSLDPSSGAAKRSATSPRAGILWMPMPTWSVYASYARSFNPQLIATQSNALADPQRGRQLEVGTKVDLRRDLSATVSVFDLRKTNVPNANPLGPTFPALLSGEERSRGVEVELRGQLAPGLDVSFAYTHLDPEVLQSNNGDQGNQLAGTARNTVNAWLSYTMTSGLGGGVGVASTGPVYASNANGLRVDSHTLADASLWWRPNGSLGKGVSLGLTLKNIFDKHYFLTANGFQTSLTPGTPRSVLATVGYGF